MATVPTILGDLYVDDQGNDGEPVALLWPSLFTDHTMWRHQIPALQAAGWRTLALDPPGHGRSPGPHRTFTMDECAEAVLQVLDARQVHTPVAFLGTSWGGFVAPRVALRAPERVRAMVLTNTSAERGNPLELTRARVLAKLLGVSALDKVTVRLIMAGLLAPETRRQQPAIGVDLTQRLLSWNRWGLVEAVRSVLVDRDPVLDKLPKISTPALIVSGQEDHTLPAIHSKRIVAKLSNARHVEVPRAAHLAPLEQPEESNKLILDFVEDLRGPRSEATPTSGDREHPTANPQSTDNGMR